MNAKKFISLMLPIGLLLTSCYKPSLTGSRIFKNYYDSYEEMTKDIKTLWKNAPEEEKFLFDFDVKGYSKKYVIGGIDCCMGMGFINNYQQHDPDRCYYLIHKAIFFEFLKDDFRATVSFRQKRILDFSKVSWSSVDYTLGDPGDYAWSGIGAKSAYYLQYDQKNISVLQFGVENVPEETVNLFQNIVYQGFLDNYNK